MSLSLCEAGASVNRSLSVLVGKKVCSQTLAAKAHSLSTLHSARHDLIPSTKGSLVAARVFTSNVPRETVTG